MRRCILVQAEKRPDQFFARKRFEANPSEGNALRVQSRRPLPEGQASDGR